MNKYTPSLLLFAGWLLSLSLSMVAQAQNADEQAVMDTEKMRFEAQVKKDYGTLEKVLADDLFYTHSSGTTDSKTSYIQSIKDGKSAYEAITPEEMKVRIYGKMAIINGTCSIKMPTTNLHLRYTDVYIKRKGQWQMVAWQSLKLAQ